MNKPPAEAPSDQNRFRQLVERASDIIYETDANGYFTYANPVASRRVGRPIEELVGLRFTQLIREDVRRAAEEFYAKQAMTGTATTYSEFPMMTANTRRRLELWPLRTDTNPAARTGVQGTWPIAVGAGVASSARSWAAAMEQPVSAARW